VPRVFPCTASARKCTTYVAEALLCVFRDIWSLHGYSRSFMMVPVMSNLAYVYHLKLLELLDGGAVKIHRESGQKHVTYRAMISGSLELMSPRSSTMTATEGGTAQLLTGNFKGTRLPISQFLRDCNKTFDKLCVISKPRVFSRVPTTACFATRSGHSSVKMSPICHRKDTCIPYVSFGTVDHLSNAARETTQ
jgi:hypothetical protein